MTREGRRVPFVFRVAGIDAAQIEFPPQVGNGTYYVWGTPAFYRQHRALDGFTQIALRFHHGSRDWPAVRRELRRRAHGKPIQAGLLSSQSALNTSGGIRPQAGTVAARRAVRRHRAAHRGPAAGPAGFLEATEYGAFALSG